MKFCFIFIIAFLFSYTDVSAEKTLNQATSGYVKRVTSRYENSVLSLTRYLVKPYNNDYDKARAIAYYIASHMAYDEYQYNNETGRTRLEYRRQRPEDFLKTKVGICADFAQLFTEMCKQAGIPAGVIEGYIVKPIRSRNYYQKKGTAHAWNYFIYKNKKVYVDTTFMSTGRTGHERYVTEFDRARALNKIQKQNRYSMKTYNINPYYFDFTYDQEKRNGYELHVEK